MFIPPNPGTDDDKNQISDKPLPVMKPHATPASGGAAPAGDVPQGEGLFAYVVECLDQGSSKPEVRKQLIAFGYSAADAEQAVEDASERRRRSPGRYAAPPSIMANVGAGNSGNTNMLIGGGICLLGIVITVGSCMAAGEGGGRYFIAYGAIIWGAIQFFRGLAQSNQS